jgi:hypothetical protein
LAVCVEQLSLGHAYDEYSVLAQEPGMTLRHCHIAQQIAAASKIAQKDLNLY